MVCPEVEDAAATRFALIFGDDFSLQLHAFGNHSVSDHRITREDRIAAVAKHGKERRVGDDSALDDFIKTGVILPIGQSGEQRRIDQDSVRLVKTSDQIFAARQIDARLSADSGVDLREERRGHLNDWKSTHKDSGKETSHVIDDAAAKGDDYAGTIRAGVNHALGQGFESCQSLVRFAAGKEKDAVGDAFQELAVRIPNGFFGDDKTRP